ncbi:hypothetical protein C6988_03080 [Nitrosopumilus sp. b1]|uniref:hypothetical protein n=1 Tax=Nitrosopumilus sp. b1 TaxID=2109907 RepID=UPI0015F4DE48|nr:hypothetical protein [Nitrosopumilus sp. b1]KAF6243517.1 hypothetical protein C6988_03080 [Nitrosopumilus sp. b1]
MQQTESKPITIKIKKLDINQSYFFGAATINEKEYKINVQGHWKEKLIKLPVSYPKQERVLIRLSGESGAFIEDIVAHRGNSEWIEIDSDEILHYIADHQDELDTIEVYLNES